MSQAEQLNIHPSCNKSLAFYHSGPSRELAPPNNSEMNKLGISSFHEHKRFIDVSRVAGTEVAMREVERNLAAYEHEFLHDLPVSKPCQYFHLDGSLYSENIQNPIFKIGNQIDKRERDGKTAEGFSRFEKTIIDSRVPLGVSLWYSHAGSAGSSPPFSNISYDSGRLYICVNGQQGESVHVDVKIDESKFPIYSLLNYIKTLSGHDFEQVVIPGEKMGEYYLGNPIDTKMAVRSFSEHLRHFLGHCGHGNATYISRRKSTSPTPFSFYQICQDFDSAIIEGLGNNRDKLVHAPKYYKNKGLTPNQDDIRGMYISLAFQHAQNNNGRVELYGCSTTSYFDISDRDFAPGLQKSLSLFDNKDVTMLSYFGSAQKYSTRSRVLSGGASSEGRGDESESACVTCPHCENKRENKRIDGVYICGNPNCITNIKN